MRSTDPGEDRRRSRLTLRELAGRCGLVLICLGAELLLLVVRMLASLVGRVAAAAAPSAELL